MKYFEFGIIFIIIFVVISLIVFRYRLRKRFFRSYVLRKIAQYCSIQAKDGIFSGALILDVADLVFSAAKKQQEILIKAINSEKFDVLIDYVLTKNAVLAYFLMSCFDIKKGKSFLQNYVKQHTDNALANLVLAFIYDKEFDYLKLRKTLEKLHAYKVSKVQKILMLLLEARIDMLDSDMLSASKKVMLIIKIFKKYNMFYEEASAYMMLGEIYRISAVFDLSYVMYESAEKIYLSVDDVIRCAEVKSLKAMLLIAQDRFEEAKELFDDTVKVFHKNKLYVKEAEVINQQSLMSLLQKKCSKSLKYADKALQIHKKNKNLRGESFSYELLAMVNYQLKKYDLAYDNANISMNLYLKTKNYSGYQDVAFMAAQSAFSLEKYDVAENICREIIKVYEKNSTCFHIANVYSLLGLIYVKLKDYGRATALYKKSLLLEQCNERYSAAATDYTNLALIYKHSGQLEKAKENLCSALDSAKVYQDLELCALIEKQVEEINRLLDNK